MGNFMFIQDVSLPTGSRLYAGSKIFLYADSLKETFNVNLQPQTENMVDTSITNADLLDGGVSGNYDRRLGESSFASFENPLWVISGAWNQDLKFDGKHFATLGSELILTPYRLKRFATSTHQSMIWDDKLIGNYSNGDDVDIIFGTGSMSYFYSGSGPQVLIKSYNIGRDTSNNLKFTITLQEVKD